MIWERCEGWTVGQRRKTNSQDVSVSLEAIV
jgi:hypothetical protein